MMRVQCQSAQPSARPSALPAAALRLGSRSPLGLPLAGGSPVNAHQLPTASAPISSTTSSTSIRLRSSISARAVPGDLSGSLPGQQDSLPAGPTPNTPESGLSKWWSQHWRACATAAVIVIAMVLGSTLSPSTSQASAQAAAEASAMRAAAPSLASVSLGDMVGERVLWLLGKVAGLNVATKVLLVILSTLPFVAAFGVVYSVITRLDLHASCVRMYALLNRLPGAKVLEEKSAMAAVFVNGVYFLGVFVFAVVLGVVTEEIKATFKDVRNGKYPVNQADHLVVLGWSSQTVPLLRQVAAARKANSDPLFQRPVAILGEASKVEMDAAIRKVKTLQGMEIYARNGSPHVPADLASVAAQKAAAVIVLAPSSAMSSSPLAPTIMGSTQAQVALALAAASPALHTQHVVFQAPQPQGMAVAHVESFKRLAKLGVDVQVMGFSDKTMENRIMAVTALQPGLQRVLLQLVGAGNASLRAQPVPPSLVGCTYQHARRQFADGVVCGLLEQGQRSNMAVPETRVVQKDDELIMLSPTPDVELNGKAEAVFLRAAQEAEARVQGRRGSYKSSPRSIVVVTLDPEECSSMIDGFGELAPKGSTVTFLMPKQPAGSLPSRKGQCAFRYLVPSNPSESSCCTSALLKEAGVESATAVVVMGLDALTPTDADAFVTATLLQVQDVLNASGRREAPHFVAQIRKASTQTSINTFLNLMRKEAKKASARCTGNHIIARPDLFISDDMATTVLAQAAAQPCYAQLVTDLLDSDGAELYFRNPAVYNLNPGDLQTFADIAESARAFNETAIGIFRGSDGFITLAPAPTDPFNLQAGDRVVVLAEEYAVTANPANKKKA